MKYLKYKIKKFIHQMFYKPSIYNVFVLCIIGGDVETKCNELHKIDVRGVINSNNQSVIYYPHQDLSYKIIGDNILNLFDDGWFRAIESGKTIIEVSSKIDPLLSIQFKVKITERDNKE